MGWDDAWYRGILPLKGSSRLWEALRSYYTSILWVAMRRYSDFKEFVSVVHLQLMHAKGGLRGVVRVQYEFLNGSTVWSACSRLRTGCMTPDISYLSSCSHCPWNNGMSSIFCSAQMALYRTDWRKIRRLCRLSSLNPPDQLFLSTAS